MFYFFFTLLVMAPRYEIQTESKLNLLHLQVSVVIYYHLPIFQVTKNLLLRLCQVVSVRCKAACSFFRFEPLSTLRAVGGHTQIW